MFETYKVSVNADGQKVILDDQKFALAYGNTISFGIILDGDIVFSVSHDAYDVKVSIHNNLFTLIGTGNLQSSGHIPKEEWLSDDAKIFWYITWGLNGLGEQPEPLAIKVYPETFLEIKLSSHKYNFILIIKDGSASFTKESIRF